MSDYLQDFVTALQVKLGTVWTEILPANSGGGTFDAEHVAQVPWKDLTPPFAVTIITDLQKAPNSPLSGQYYHCSADCLLVRSTEGPGTGLRTKLVALQQAVWPRITLGGATVIDVPSLMWSDNLEANQFFSSKGIAYRAGVVRLNVFIGYTP